MTKLIFCILFLLYSIICLSQEKNSATGYNRDFYLKKSQNQKTAGIVLAGGGAVLMTFSSFLMDQPSPGSGTPGSGMNFTYEIVSTKEIRNVFLAIGGAAIVASIPLFISSAKNRKKAVSMGLKPESIHQLQKTGISKTSFPSLTLKIHL